MQHQSHFPLGWWSCGLQVPLCNNFSLCCYFCSLWKSSGHIHHDYYAKYLLKLQCSLLFLLIQHVQHASRYKATPSFNIRLVAKKNTYMQAADKKGRLLKYTWRSGSSCLSETQSCVQLLLGLHFLSKPLKLKLWTPGHRFSVRKFSRKKERKPGISWEDGLPRRWQSFYRVCEKYHTVITVLPQMLWLQAWNWWVMVRECCFASTKMKITPFHLSLEQPSGKQGGEVKSLFQLPSFLVQKQSSLIIKIALTELVTAPLWQQLPH